MNSVIIGQGGHSKVVRDLIVADSKNKIVGVFDDKYESLILKDNIYYGPIDAARRMLTMFDDIEYFVGIGSNEVRKKIVEKLGLPDELYMTLIHPTAVISPGTKIGHGTIIMPQAVINADTEIGRHSIINTGALIEHDNRVGDFVHVSPNATLTGAVEVGVGSHIGAGATVIPNKQIGAWSTIGAGATVIEDIPSFCTAVGIPAKVIEQKVAGGV